MTSLKTMLRWDGDRPRGAGSGETVDMFMGAGSKLSFRVGTKAAGCLLDGVEHHEFPAVQA